MNRKFFARPQPDAQELFKLAYQNLLSASAIYSDQLSYLNGFGHQDFIYGRHREQHLYNLEADPTTALFTKLKTMLSFLSVSMPQVRFNICPFAVGHSWIPTFLLHR